MGSDVIKEFLVSLGFSVDGESLNRFNKSVTEATLKVTALFAAVQATAAGIAFGITKISQSFEDIGYEYRLIAPAFNRFLFIRNELFKAYSRAGLSLTQTVQAAIKLNLSLTRTKIALEAIYNSVGARFFKLFTKESDIFREKLYQNMPKIQHVLQQFVDFIFKAFGVTVLLGERVWEILTRVYNFFIVLNRATHGWLGLILAVVVAWRSLNLMFLITPLGLLLELGVAIVGLYDDFKTFQSGGKSFFDWGKTSTKLLAGLVALIGGVTVATYAWRAAMAAWAVVASIFNGLLYLTAGGFELIAGALAVIEAPIWLIIGAVVALIAALVWLEKKWQIFERAGTAIKDFFAGGSAIPGYVQDASGFFTKPNAQANLGNAGDLSSGIPGGIPLGSTSNNNRNLHQTNNTNINVTSTADAQSVGNHVLNGQASVSKNNTAALSKNLFGSVK